MADLAGVCSINIGAKEPVYASHTAPSGTTNTISGSPVYSLYDAAGVIVTGHSGQAATGFDNTALASPKVWKTLDTTSPAVLTEQKYRMVFTFTSTNSADSIARTKVEEVIVNVKSIP